MIAGLLFSRAGFKTIVAEKHADFLRDFRGDTVHPSTLEIFNRLGLLESFLQRPHQKLSQIGVRWRGELLAAADLSRLKVAAPYVAFMPQWEFLDYVADTARESPHFELLMRAEAQGLIEDGGKVAGLRLATPQGPRDIRARLTIAADGRGSVVRAAAGLPLKVLGAPVDVLWFALPRGTAPVQDSLINAAPGTLVVTIDRGSYWQCAFVIDKGGRAPLEAAGLDTLKARVAEAAPHVASELGALKSWDEIKLLSVAVDRLERWSRPGLLALGDAAHAMSPIGGVGINLAVQDAVAAANLLVPKLRAGELSADDLDLVRRRRLWPTRATQFVQVQIQNRLLAPLIAGKGPAQSPPLPMRLAGWFPPLRRALARAVGLGVRPELPDPSLFG
ncbi:MAG: FAD-dependent oxidoreductase [Rhizobiaceae bacterium]|nr:FAD-dependent oxidoreductase [Rhizobiaceae bacterium]